VRELGYAVANRVLARTIRPRRFVSYRTIRQPFHLIALARFAVCCVIFVPVGSLSAGGSADLFPQAGRCRLRRKVIMPPSPDRAPGPPVGSGSAAISRARPCVGLRGTARDLLRKSLMTGITQKRHSANPFQLGLCRYRGPRLQWSTRTTPHKNSPQNPSDFKGKPVIPPHLSSRK